VVDLAHNKLRELDKKLFWESPLIEEVDVSHNLIEKDLDCFITCKRLKKLDISHNQISSLQSLQPLRFCKRLEVLAIGKNPALELGVDTKAIIIAAGGHNLRIGKLSFTKSWEL